MMAGPKKWLYKFYNIFFEKNPINPLIISVAISIILTFFAHYYEVYPAFEEVVILEVGATSTALFAILFSSIAILIAISEGTLKLSKKNSKWFSNYSSITNKLRRPVILSLSLAAMCLLIPPILTIFGGETWHSMLFVVMILSINLYLIILIGEVIVRMLSHVKASIGQDVDGTGQEYTAVLITSKQSCIHELNRLQKNLRSFTNRSATILEKVSIYEPEGQDTRSIDNISNGIVNIMHSIQDLEHSENEYDLFLSTNSELSIYKYHDSMSKFIAIMERELLEVNRSLDEIEQFEKDIVDIERITKIHKGGIRSIIPKDKAIYNMSRSVRGMENIVILIERSCYNLKKVLLGEEI